MDVLKRLYELYALIPSSMCLDGCCSCCFDLIQMSSEERDNMGGYEFTDRCVHLIDGHCSVYERRPLVCRIYGSSELLHCEDCKADGKLTAEQTRVIMKEYKSILNKE